MTYTHTALLHTLQQLYFLTIKVHTSLGKKKKNTATYMPIGVTNKCLLLKSYHIVPWSKNQREFPFHKPKSRANKICCNMYLETVQQLLGV
jgi:hypothetical protein